MLLLYLAVGVFLSGAVTSTPRELTVTKYAEVVTADHVFNTHIRRLYTRKGPNVTQIVNLVQQGSQVAEKVKNVFDDIYSLKGNNISQLIDVGKEIYEVGKEVYEVGKEIYEVGKDLISAGKEFLDAHKQVLQVGKTMAKTLGQIAAHLGPALGGIGLAFAVINMFVPKEDSEELKALKAGFREMHGRFDQIANQIDRLGYKIDFYQAIKPYQEVRDDLANVYRDYTNLAEMPASEGYRKAFHDACTNQNIEPLQALEKLRRIVVKPGPEDQPHMLTAIITQYKMDYNMVMGWFERITVNAYTLATLKAACFGALYGKDDAGMSHSLNQTETWVKEIVQELAKYEEKFTSLDPEFVHLFDQELNEVVEKATLNTTAEKQVNDYCMTTEKELVGYYSLCMGDDAVNTQRVAVVNHLMTKYFWLDWMVMVYTQDEGNEDNPCTVGQDSKHWVHTKNAEQRVFVTWSRKDADEAVGLRHAARQELEARLKDFDPDWADSKGTWFGEKGKYFIVYNNMVDREIKKWLDSIKYPRKLFCTFGGYTGYYYRSVMTSGIAAHRSQSAYRYIVDYLVAFY